jgi:NCAIR mutase (PurE)-related protein
VLVTKVSEECFDAVKGLVPEAEYHPQARVIIINRAKEPPSRPGIMVVSGGTSDIPIAEEAVLTAELMGNLVERAYDVGVAGVHRLLDHLPRLRQARVVVAVAGMEGALPSVVSGLVSAPVIAVPTSVGYGASFGGLAALLTMLNSCSAGVSVVNIDNGFGAGYLAALINR